MLKFFAPCPKGLEGLLFNELTSLNLKNVKENKKHKISMEKQNLFN